MSYALVSITKFSYYDYTINASTVDNYTKSGKYLATVDINMTHSPKRYSVSLNGTLAGSNYTYQEYAELSLPEGSASAKWYACAEDAESPADNDPVLATGTSYKFRVKGNTYLRTVTGNIDDENFNRSEVDFSHYEVTHRDVTDASTTPATTVTKEYLLQNFYIADFFDKNKFYDLSRTYVENGVTKYLPYDEVNFVGGGVIYYSMKDGSPNANTVSAGYVNDSGVAEADAVKEMLKARIMENYDSSLAAEIGEEDATKVAYGTKIDVTKNVENGFNTGVFYRYLPLETYKRDGSGNLEKDSDLNYTLATTLNDNTFRYSNALHSYQYVYASGNENKVTNNGKNMRLYAYYVYSYLTYDQETNLPEVKYDIVLSNSYSDASTYWNGVS